MHKFKTLGLVLIITFLLFSSSLKADTTSQLLDKSALDHAWRKGEYQNLSFMQKNLTGEFTEGGSSTNPRIFQEIDVLHYTIDAHFYPGTSYPDNSYLTASSTIEAKAKSVMLNQVIIDFYDNITITAFRLNGLDFSSYTRSNNKIWMNLSSDPLEPGEEFEITIDYTHVYGSISQGLMFSKHGSNNTPAICSIDQPYESPGWWPCFDYPSDKATGDIYITCPDWMIGVSNGLLQPGYPINNFDGTKT